MPIQSRIYCIATRKDNLKHKGNAKSICSPSPPPQSVTSFSSAPYAAVNSRKQLSRSCVYTDPVAMLPALLADCHAVAFSRYAVLHSVVCKHFSLQNESSVWGTVFFFLYQKRTSFYFCRGALTVSLSKGRYFQMFFTWALILNTSKCSFQLFRDILAIPY